MSIGKERTIRPVKCNGFRKKNGSSVVWDNEKNTIAYDTKSILLRAAADYVIMLLVFSALFDCIPDVFTGVNIGASCRVGILFCVTVMVILHSIIVPVLWRRFDDVSMLCKLGCHATAIPADGIIAFLMLALNKDSVFLWVRKTINQYAYLYTSYFYEGSKVRPLAIDRLSLAFVIFSLVFAGIVIWGYYVLPKFRYIMLLIPAAPLGIFMYIGESPRWYFFVKVLIAFLLLCAVSDANRIGCGTESAEQTSESLKAYIFSGPLVHISIILVVITMSTFVFSKPAEWISENRIGIYFWQADVERRIYDFAVLLKNQLNDADKIFVSADDPGYCDRIIGDLSISGPVDNNIYLINNYGSEYKNGKWTYNAEKFEKACKKAGFDADSVREIIAGNFFSKRNAFGNSSNITTYTVSYNIYESNNALLPYFASANDIMSNSKGDVLIKLTSVSSVSRCDAFGRVNYDIDSLNKLINSVSESESEVWDFYDDYVISNYLKTNKSVPTAKKMAEYYLTKTPDDNLTDDKAVNRWRYKMAGEIAYVFAGYDYNWNLDISDSKSSNFEVIEYFLNEGHKGYAVHFATAGVLILREMGIPARIASGYVLNGNTINESTIILDRDSHAWVEIYLNHIGWVPVEMTPSYTIYDDNITTGQEEKKLNEPINFVAGGGDEILPWIDQRDNVSAGDEYDAVPGLGPIAGFIAGSQLDNDKNLPGPIFGFEYGNPFDGSVEDSITTGPGFSLSAVMGAIPGYLQGPGMKLSKELFNSPEHDHGSGFDDGSDDEDSDRNIFVNPYFGRLDTPDEGSNTNGKEISGPKIWIGPHWEIMGPEGSEGDYYGTQSGNMIQIGPSITYRFGDSLEENNSKQEPEESIISGNADKHYEVDLTPKPQEIKPDTNMEKEKEDETDLIPIPPQDSPEPDVHGNEGDEPEINHDPDSWGETDSQTDFAQTEGGDTGTENGNHIVGEEGNLGPLGETDNNSETMVTQTQQGLVNRIIKWISDKREIILLIYNFRLTIIKVEIIVFAGKLLLFIAGNIVGLIITGIKLGIISYYKVIDDLINQKKNRSAVLKINRRLYKRMRFTGRLKTVFPTDDDFENILINNFGTVSEENWHRFMEIAKEAGFSRTQNEITDEDIIFCNDIYGKIKPVKRDYWFRLYLPEFWKNIVRRKKNEAQ